MSDMDHFSLIDNNGVDNQSIQSSQTMPIGVMPNMQLPYADDTSTVYKPLMPGTSPPPLSSTAQVYQPVGDDSTLPETDTSIPVSTDQAKRKRGRPRKYALDGSAVPGTGSSDPTVKQQAVIGSGGLPSPSTGKKRGRPLGSGRKHLQALGGIPPSSSLSILSGRGSGFTAHVIIVEAGEDIASKILSFAESGLQALCVITATGAVSNVTIRQNSSTPSVTVSYEGRFEIVTLSGSYIVSEIGGQRNTSGGLSTLLAGSDGHVLGGCIAGLLIAASTVQIVVGCFIPKKEYPWKQARQSIAAGGGGGGGSSTSRGTMSECSGGGPGSPLNQTSVGGGVVVGVVGGGGPEAPAWHHNHHLHDGNREEQQHPW